MQERFHGAAGRVHLDTAPARNANWLTQRRKGGGSLLHLILASLRLERSGREHSICHFIWASALQPSPDLQRNAQRFIGRREDTMGDGATWAKGVGRVTSVVFPDPWGVGTEVDLATSGTPTPLCGLEAWRLFHFWSRQGQAGEAKPRSRKASKGTGRKKEAPNIRVLLSFLSPPCSRVLRRGSRDSWALCDSWFRDLRFPDHEWAHAKNRPSTERVFCSDELAVFNAGAG
jgi:hypothetical protein